MKLLNILFLCLVFNVFSLAQPASEPLQFKHRIVFNDAKELLVARKFFDDDRKIVFIGIKTIQFWDALSGKLIESRPHEIPNLDKSDNAVVISPDGQKAIALDTFSRRLVRKEKKVSATIWNLQTGRQIAVLERPQNSIRSARWSENGRTLLTSDESYKDKEICFWNAENFQFNGAILLKGISYWNYLSRDGNTFYAYSQFAKNGNSSLMTYALNSWNTESAQLKEKFNSLGADFTIGENGISSDEKFLAAATNENIIVWKIGESRFFKYTIKPSKPGRRIYFKGFSPDGKSFAVYQDKNLNLYDSETGSLKESVSTDKSPLQLNVKLSPDGKFIALQKCDFADVFNLKTRQKSYQLKLVCKESFDILDSYPRDFDVLRFQPNGNLLLTASDKTVRLWNSESGKLIQTLADPNRIENKRKDENKDDGLGWSAGWVRNGDFLFASGADGKSILLWEMKK